MDNNKEIEFTIRNILGKHLNNFYQENGLSVPCKTRTEAEDKIINAIMPLINPKEEFDSIQKDKDSLISVLGKIKDEANILKQVDTSDKNQLAIYNVFHFSNIELSKYK